MDDLFDVSSEETKEKVNFKDKKGTKVKEKINPNFNKDIFGNELKDIKITTTETRTHLEDISERNKRSIKDKSKVRNNRNFKNDKIISKGFILIIIAFAVFALAFWGYKNFFGKPKSAKPYILQALKNQDMLKGFNIEGYKILTNNLNNKSYEIVSTGKINPKFLDKKQNEGEKENIDNNVESQKELDDDKIKIKDFDVVFKGAVNNKGDNKSSLIETNIIWDKTSVTSWSVFENKDILLLDAPEYFKEMIGINKENIDKVIKKNSEIGKLYKSAIKRNDENIFEEMVMLNEVINKSLITSLEKILPQNFSVDKKVSTTYKDEKQFADNYKLRLDKISLEVIFETLLKDIDTAFQIDASRYKIFNRNKKEIENLIKKLKPNIEDTDKIEITMYKIKNSIPKVDVVLKGKDEDRKIFQLEINKTDKKDAKKELIAIFGNTKMRIEETKEKDQNNLVIDFETLKSNITEIKPNEIKIENEQENKENNNNQVTDITVSKNISKHNLLSQNQEIKHQDLVEPLKRNKPKDIKDIMNAKEDEKFILKFEFKTPANPNATNIRLDLNVFSSIFDIYLENKLVFKEGIVIDMMNGDRIFLDAMQDEERTKLYKNIIEPTIVSVTARKLDEINRKKQAR